MYYEEFSLIQREKSKYKILIVTDSKRKSIISYSYVVKYDMRIYLKAIKERFPHLESLNYDSLPDETKDKFMECITCIPFISYMISPDRKRAKDLPRDKEGRIIVDICHPHILEDMDYFRPSAIHFQKYN